MRLAVIKSHLALVEVRGAIDMEAVSAGKFLPAPQAIYERWAQFSAWYAAKGDLIFTGTPAGIGRARDPKVVLRPGDPLVTHAEVIGEMTTMFTAA
jgi:Fumarylacetoacetate (FAA) hydrolase family